jgi:hypothetical protein
MDHITKPQVTYPNFDYSTGSIDGSTTYPMNNYQGIAYNWIIGGNIPIGKCGIDLSASYFQMYTLDLNATFEAPHFFLGFSVLQDNNNENVIFGTNDYYHYAFIGGIKAYHNKIKISLAYNYYQQTFPGQPPTIPLESSVSYSF